MRINTYDVKNNRTLMIINNSDNEVKLGGKVSIKSSLYFTSKLIISMKTLL